MTRTSSVKVKKVWYQLTNSHVKCFRQFLSCLSQSKKMILKLYSWEAFFMTMFYSLKNQRIILNIRSFLMYVRTITYHLLYCCGYYRDVFQLFSVQMLDKRPQELWKIPKLQASAQTLWKRNAYMNDFSYTIRRKWTFFVGGGWGGEYKKMLD